MRVGERRGRGASLSLAPLFRRRRVGEWDECSDSVRMGFGDVEIEPEMMEALSPGLAMAN